ncbi:MAG: COX15/CtaA family protein [Myxococcales bacterium]|nr:COX15/CtaA family protein [Myxococcales bacterium]
MPNAREAPSRAVVIWLLFIFAVIGVMVIGGITRLTGSGLSITEWDPIMGAVPPLNKEEWQEAFAKYQAIPEYRLINSHMDLAGFKRIFFWEYLHRLLGRLIGVFFFVPWLWFTVRRQLRGRWAVRGLIAFALGGLQGLLGWFMVKSGLVDVPAVSHFRLAAHLSLAFFVGCYVLWFALDLRPGPRTADNPEGLYPVDPGKLPVFLDDVLSDLRTLERRYGPYAEGGRYHPGFIGGAVEARLFEEDLQMVVRANVNGVPDKGLDLTDGTVAGVNSIDDHPETLFNFDDPAWLSIEGSFRDPPTIDRMIFAMGEDARFLPGGTARDPMPRGDSPVWTAPAYTLERVVAEAAFARWQDHSLHREFRRRDEGEPLLLLDVQNGWLSLATPGRVGDPPAPTYIWDLITEVAQIRVHDGEPRLEEGDANLVFTLEDVPLGLSMADLIGGVKASLRADPSSLVTVASALFDNTWGAADFFYRHPADGSGDWLFFIAPEDIPNDHDGRPVRPYRYEKPGFFSDPELTMQIATRTAIDGDDTHLKVQVNPGDVLYVVDDMERVYQMKIGEKPSRARLPLTLTRIR